jgi:hypothetical protein
MQVPRCRAEAKTRALPTILCSSYDTHLLLFHLQDQRQGLVVHIHPLGGPIPRRGAHRPTPLGLLVKLPLGDGGWWRVRAQMWGIMSGVGQCQLIRICLMPTRIVDQRWSLFTCSSRANLKSSSCLLSAAAMHRTSM